MQDANITKAILSHRVVPDVLERVASERVASADSCDSSTEKGPVRVTPANNLASDENGLKNDISQETKSDSLTAQDGFNHSNQFVKSTEVKFMPLAPLCITSCPSHRVESPTSTAHSEPFPGFPGFSGREWKSATFVSHLRNSLTQWSMVCLQSTPDDEFSSNPNFNTSSSVIINGLVSAKNFNLEAKKLVTPLAVMY